MIETRVQLKFHEDVRFIEEAAGVLRLKSPWIDLIWKTPFPALHRSLYILAESGACEDGLADQVLEEEGKKGLLLFYHELDKLKRHALLSCTLFCKEEPLVALEPLSSTLEWHEEPIPPTRLLKLSRFCFSYSLDGERVLETPLNAARIILKKKESAFLVRALTVPTTLRDLYTAFPQYTAPAIESFLKLLKSAKML